MFLEQLKISVRAIIAFTILTGLIYPLVMTGAMQIIFPRQSNGSLIYSQGKPIGSMLIGQQFDDPKYFWGRISTTSPVPYNASNSSGSNLGPLNSALLDQVKARIDALQKADPENKQRIPVDLVTSSASGLDPEITPAAATYQLKRVARDRGLKESTVEQLVQQNTRGRFFGLIGESRVNVLKLNLALDQAKDK